MIINISREGYLVIYFLKISHMGLMFVFFPVGDMTALEVLNPLVYSIQLIVNYYLAGGGVEVVGRQGVIRVNDGF